MSFTKKILEKDQGFIEIIYETLKLFSIVLLVGFHIFNVVVYAYEDRC